MDKFYFNDLYGYLCAECAEDIYSENLDKLPEASIVATECDRCEENKRFFLSRVDKSIRGIMESLS